MKPDNPLLQALPDSPEEDRLLGDFVRQLNRAALRTKYAKRLTTDHGIVEPECPRVSTVLAPDRPLRTVWRSRVAQIAALTLLIFSAGTAWYFSERASAEQELLAAYLLVEDYYVPITRSAPAQQLPLTVIERQLLLDFGAQRFDKITALINVPLTPTGNFFLALSFIATERPEEALQTLALISADDPEYGVEADWYATLLRLKWGNRAKAIERLQYYAASEEFLSVRARALLEVVNKQ
jgi:hypothetical protein